MYETAILKPFKLKTTNGDKLAYYGNCNINITSVPFENLKNRNQSETPFEIEKGKYYLKKNKNIKIKTTTHVMAIPSISIYGNTPPQPLYIKALSSEYNTDIVQAIPKTNDPVVFNSLNAFITSIKSTSLKNTMLSILYNITHGNTPYSNIDVQSYAVENTFAVFNNDTDTPIWRGEPAYPTGKSNYPQNSILLVSQEWDDVSEMAYNCFFYRKETQCKQISVGDYAYCMPSYGISLDTSGTSYIYWTTYKGV